MKYVFMVGSPTGHFVVPRFMLAIKPGKPRGLTSLLPIRDPVHTQHSDSPVFGRREVVEKILWAICCGDPKKVGTR